MIIEAWPHTNLVSITALSSWWHAVIHWVHRPPWSVTMLKSGLHACALVVMVRVSSAGVGRLPWLCLRSGASLELLLVMLLVIRLAR